MTCTQLGSGRGLSPHVSIHSVFSNGDGMEAVKASRGRRLQIWWQMKDDGEHGERNVYLKQSRE
jgi:hypothetical protein